MIQYMDSSFIKYLRTMGFSDYQILKKLRDADSGFYITQTGGEMFVKPENPNCVYYRDPKTGCIYWIDDQMDFHYCNPGGKCDGMIIRKGTEEYRRIIGDTAYAYPTTQGVMHSSMPSSMPSTIPVPSEPIHYIIQYNPPAQTYIKPDDLETKELYSAILYHPSDYMMRNDNNALIINNKYSHLEGKGSGILYFTPDLEHAKCSKLKYIHKCKIHKPIVVQFVDGDEFKGDIESLIDYIPEEKENIQGIEFRLKKNDKTVSEYYILDPFSNMYIETLIKN